MNRKLIASLVLVIPLTILIGCNKSATTSKPVAEGGGIRGADKDKRTMSVTVGPNAVAPKPK